MDRSHVGIRLPLTPMRRLVIEDLHQARKVPTVSVTRPYRLAELAEARRQSSLRPSWTALFMRAYALVARDTPELRRCWMPWPRPHLYEHPHSVAGLVVEREWQGEPMLLASRFRGPENMSLDVIDARMRHLKEAPFESVGDFRRLLRAGQLPSPLLRFAAWAHLSVSGAFRSRKMGTFMMTSVGSLGVSAVNPHCMLSSLLSLGPITADGETLLNVTFDHRIADGRPIARALNELERVLQTTLLDELRPQGRRAA